MTVREEIRICLNCKKPKCNNCMQNSVRHGKDEPRKNHKWTQKDMKLLANENLTTKQIANMIGISCAAVQRKKYERRKQNERT